MAVSKLAKEKQSKKIIKKVKKIKIPEKVETQSAPSADMSESISDSDESSVKSTTSSKKGISVGKINPKKKITKKKKILTSDQQWNKVVKPIKVLYSNYIAIKANNGKVSKSDYNKIISHTKKIKKLSSKPDIRNKPEYAEDISKIDEIYDYFTDTSNITIN